MIKFPNKMVYVLAGIVAGAVITTVTTTSAAQIVRQQAQGSSETISSNASSEVSSEASEILSNAEPSSKVSSEEESTPASEPESKTKIESETDAGVSKIHEATDAGVSQIHDEAQRAVQEVQKAVSDVTSSESGPKITYGQNRITGTIKYHQKNRNWVVALEGTMREIDETNKCLVVHYGGTYPELKDAQVLIDAGFTLKNVQGNAVEYQPNGFCSFKVPYENLSDVSELYFCYGDQSIKITVTE